MKCDDGFMCQLCAYVTPSFSYFKRHIKIHGDKRSFKCSFCDRSFIRKTGLIIHLRTHTGEKPFECNICLKRFSDKSNFKKHLRTH